VDVIAQCVEAEAPGLHIIHTDQIRHSTLLNNCLAKHLNHEMVPDIGAFDLTSVRQESTLVR
jgi:hypothetical protein